LGSVPLDEARTIFLPMGDFVVRDWLAARLGREAHQLDITGVVRSTARGQEARYEVDGGDMASVLITWASPGGGGRSSRTVIGTLPDGGARDVIDGTDFVRW
jgi:hypothetical protein